MATFTIDINFGNAIKRLGQVAGRLANLEPAFTKGVNRLVRSMLRENWETEGAAFGNPWAPLAITTVHRKTREGTIGGGSLVSSGGFKRLFTEGIGLQDIYVVSGRNASAFSVSSALLRPRWTWHQRGTQNMSARIVVPNPPSLIQDIKNLLLQYIVMGKGT